jgi:RNA polymerase sigma-70 factor (ECF subfamily)
MLGVARVVLEMAMGGEPEDDLAVIARVAGGETGAFRVLVERYQGRLWRYCWQVLGDRGEAEDCVQEAFVSAYRALANYDAGRGAFSAWLYRIARNGAVDRLARMKRRPVALGSAAPWGTGGGERADERGLSPAEAAEANEVFRCLDQALAAMPAELGRTYLAVERAGLSYQEAAEAEGVPVGTVRSRVARARDRLREALAAMAQGGAKR